MCTACRWKRPQAFPFPRGLGSPKDVLITPCVAWASSSVRFPTSPIRERPKQQSAALSSSSRSILHHGGIPTSDPHCRIPCAAGHARGTEVAPGLTVCRPAAAISPDRRSRLPFAAIVDSQHYTGPLGQPLAILCNPNMSAGANDYLCEISYRLDHDVGVWYEFHTSLVPLSGLIGFDRELRRRIAEAEVSDYWWPILPTSRPHVSHQ